EKLIHNIENKLYTKGIFLDFNKAFDSIKHNILFNKLPYYGIRGVSLKLLRSYLSNRTQFVVINNIASGTDNIRYGVPQGSILGPIMFLLYINDIVLIPNTPDIVLYADDTNVFFFRPKTYHLFFLL
ncbi:MAG: reverse transcriptase domain-containing protein, partial [Anaplasma sp.]|nr:reverse transcriptase domain-containing protein [Anaplasma sp.]